MQSQWGEKPYEVMRQRVGQLWQTVPAVKICSPSLLAWSVLHLKYHRNCSQSQQPYWFLTHTLPPHTHTHTQVLPPNQTQTCLPSAWMSSIRLAARWASQAPYSKLHYKVACLCTTFPLQVTALILRAQSCSKHTLNSLTYATHKHTETLETHKNSRCRTMEAPEAFWLTLAQWL